jgi:trans-aconitate 2-methyltransferase
MNPLVIPIVLTTFAYHLKTMSQKEAVQGYYDNFVTHQKKIGISVRHYTIAKNVRKLGVSRKANILEIGCGIGTVSKLLIRMIPDGQFAGCDISPESIAAAKAFNPEPNASFICTDMSDFSHDTKFDFIVFPDVLEHIPVEQHYRLFENVAKVSSDDATILINIPEPNALDYYRETQPELLQIIDQSLSMQDLMNNTYPHGFKLVSVRPYAIATDIPNYLCIVMKNNTKVTKINRLGKIAQKLEQLKAKYL